MYSTSYLPWTSACVLFVQQPRAAVCILFVQPRAAVCIPLGPREYIQLPSVVQIQYTLDIHGTTTTKTLYKCSQCSHGDMVQAGSAETCL